MLDRLRSILQGECRLDPERAVLVGVSGGPDSLCLLDALHRLGYPLVAAHLDHGLRPESGAEARVVEQFAREMGVPCELGRADVVALAGEHGLSLEEAARTARYQFLFEQARRHHAQAVAVAHQADDQVETVLMHLLRGAGLSGLKGMAYRSLPNAWSQEIPLVRPLLGIWRQEILAYVAEHGLQPTQDASNLDTRFYRNRLRHELIPYLETYNPRLRQAIWRTADVLREDYAIMEELVEAAWQACLLEQGPGGVALDSQALHEQPLGIQRHLLRRAIGTLRPGLRDIDFDALQEALEFLSSPSRSSQRDLVAGLRLQLEGDRLWLADWEASLPGGDWPQVPDKAGLNLEVPAILDLPGGWQLQARLVDDPSQARLQASASSDPFQAWVDAASLQLPLQVRSRRPGDRFQPLGMGGHSLKLSDFLINVKLPQRARENWPLVLSAGQIVWVPGFRLAEPFQVRPETQSAVHLQLLKVTSKG